MAVVLLIGSPSAPFSGVLALMGLLGRDARDWFGAPRISADRRHDPPADRLTGFPA